LAIERVQLVEDMERVQRTVETERLRTALLTSISHDLKTPLASVIGSAGTLRDFGSKLTDSEKVELLSTVIEESERLNRFIANLLDMTRLESGAVTPKLAPHDLSEIIGSTLQRTSKILRNHPVRLDLAPNVPMVSLDPVLFEQVLFNLLDNAAKYAPPDTIVSIRTWRDQDSVILQVIDEGEGIPQGDLEHRPRTRHLAWLRRSDERYDHRGEPARPARRRLHHYSARFTRAVTGGCGMTAAPPRVLVIDDEPPIRKLLRP